MRRPLLLGALALAAMLAAAAPAGATSPDVLGALPAQAAQPVSGVVDTLPPAAEPVRQTVAAVQPAAESVRHVVDAAPAPGSDRGGPLGAAPNPVPADPVEAVRADPGRAVETTGGDLSRRVPVAPPTGELHPAAALDGALRALGDTLRGLVPVDSIAPLLGGGALGELARAALGGLVAPSVPTAATVRLSPPGGRGSLGARAWDAPAVAAHPAPVTSFKSASARPPAAEAGGRPGSPSPRKAPAPAAGGAAAPASGGFLFAPLLALLALAALVAPRLLRMLDAASALLRPALFVCALERPG